MTNERSYSADIERLRKPERLAMLEVTRIVDLCLENLTAHSMLDVGTGSGIFAEAFDARGLKVAGIDIRQDMLDAAQSYVPQGEFQLAPMEAIPYADHHFDLVFLGHVLHEADDLMQALQEAKRVASTRVVVLEWPYEAGEFGPPLDHRLKPETVLELAKQAGFSQSQQIHLQSMILYRMEL
ncbi:MAG: class I SAM-dependent methyltransferase [Anaerolineae bacterium]|nr:class I SAM-dependent methyltransferase [Anaerolineae bacterium]